MGECQSREEPLR